MQQDAKAAADSFLSELEGAHPAMRMPMQRHTRGSPMASSAHAGPDTAAQEREAEKKRQFEWLTEAAGELLDLGFEDIYQDSREAIAATLTGCVTAT